MKANRNKIWYIEIRGKPEGPYSVYDLKHDLRINPDTLVWKAGFSNWVPIRKVPELKEIFKDEDEQTKTKDFPLKDKKTSIGREELAISTQRDLPPFLFLLLVIVLILSYFLYQSGF